MSRSLLTRWPNACTMLKPTITRRFSVVQPTQSPISLIDFSVFLKGTPSERHVVGKEMIEGFKKVGFVYLSKTGLCEGNSRTKMFSILDHFFSLPKHVKDTLAWKDPRANRGYVAQGREQVTQAYEVSEIAKLRETSPDFKESMEIGREDDPQWKNHWPSENDLPGFKKEMLKFFQECHELHLEVMRALALGLTLPQDFFDDKTQQCNHTLRLLNYPPVMLKPGGSRAGAHSDYGTITLLFQDSIGGLEIEDPSTKQFTAVPPLDDTIVVNVGDLLSRWSNGILRSTLHRVVLPHAVQDDHHALLTPRRQSIAFFAHPNADTWVKALPGTGDPQDEGVRTDEYLVRRLSATYS
ncbi:hypothetical protein CROQUDRAFT_652283 [Cronartium quercuum f. sp. fusiforme G11]|uniref:Fe2OG dioxygenase domain-containing protein n=1 Tax=Cronartium quercuum f. sp. fusiforme G11 TaxID=708437 RepID=A0A9P6NRM2_9BASI|nr:hypothetical protein CROQUDRAFT_652283 [Cronartium quercuum f. sp. fusiforme G11]